MDISEALELHSRQKLNAPKIEAAEIQAGDIVLLIRKSVFERVFSGIMVYVRAVENGIVTDGEYEVASYESEDYWTGEGAGHHDRGQLGAIHSNVNPKDLNAQPTEYGDQQVLIRFAA